VSGAPERQQILVINRRHGGEGVQTSDKERFAFEHVANARGDALVKKD